MINTAFPGGVGRWEIRRSQFRQGGRPHELVVLSDLSQPLREEERQAWQRLIRVIGHEMNNLARADQVDRRQPVDDHRAGCPRPTGAKTCSEAST